MIDSFPYIIFSLLDSRIVRGLMIIEAILFRGWHIIELSFETNYSIYY
jgi:hypothetical protein